MRILFITCFSCYSLQGLSIAGGKGAAANRIFVVDVKPGGPAERNGKIQQADEILEVNEVSIRGLTHYEASAILKVSRSVKLRLINSFSLDENAPFSTTFVEVAFKTFKALLHFLTSFLFANGCFFLKTHSKVDIKVMNSPPLPKWPTCT